ncbi:hypothetical protein PBOI14_53420 [Pseudomonas sp. Boi14]|nr:hypothetical protein PBOI14_53420 [Pseudomonas sp. Boi14]
MATQGEEVVAQAHPLDLEHRLPDRRDALLQLADRGHKGFHRRLLLQWRQGPQVELAVGGQGHAGQRQEMHGQHVVGQGHRQLPADLLPRRLRFLSLGQYHIGRHLRLARHTDHLCHGVFDLGQLLEGRGDFPQLDTVTADLHLMVDAAQVVDNPAVQIARQVTGAVQALPVAAEGVRHKALGGQGRALVVTPRQAGATQVQLGRSAGRHRLQGCIQHPRTDVGQRQAQGHHRPLGRQRGGGHGQGADRGFRGAVVVEHRALRCQGRDPADQSRRAGLAAQHQALARQGTGRFFATHQRLQMRRDDLQYINLVGVQVGAEGVGVQPGIQVDHVQATAGAQGAEQRGVTKIRGDGRDHGHSARSPSGRRWMIACT